MRKLLYTASLLLASLTAAQAQNPLSYRLAAYYPFRGNAQDAVGNAHGTLRGNVVDATDRNGIATSAYAFDGYNGYIDLGTSLDSVFCGPNGQFSITAWVKLNDPSYQWTYNRLIVNKSGDSGCGEAQQQFYFRYYNGQLNFSFAGIGASFARYINSSYTISDTLWHHIAVTYDATVSGNNGVDRVRMYADGQPLTATLLPISFGPLGHILPGTGHLGIGNRLGSSGQPCQTFDVPGFFQGSIDDVAIYARQLTAGEVNQLAMPWRNGPLASPKEMTMPSVTIFPTASTEGLYQVVLPYGKALDYSITNTLGQTVQQGTLRVGAAPLLNLSAQPKGVYLARFTQGQLVSTQRIVLE